MEEVVTNPSFWGLALAVAGAAFAVAFAGAGSSIGVSYAGQAGAGPAPLRGDLRAPHAPRVRRALGPRPDHRQG